jgi:hypothetical protein
VQDKFPDDVSGDAAGPETSSGNLSFSPCKIPKTKNQCSFTCVWLSRAFIRSGVVEVSSGIRTYLYMLFARVFMLFAVK